jgi:hypothetical protein
VLHNALHADRANIAYLPLFSLPVRGGQ